MYGAIFAQQVAQICNNLQQNHLTKDVTTTQQIYATEARRIADEFGGYVNMIRFLDGVEQQIVARLQKREKTGDFSNILKFSTW